ncbi:hypothetical protein SH661x_002600 [Planctomicrobium sp. SH661]|uniref:hypothetical protein n=1 Tax=Planctomicrobium sp. SH661 TaxID=3448124 RepID=UPI003F5BAFF1
MTPDFKLPTDNLYKFLAVFGLALIALSVWGMIKGASSEVEEKARILLAQKQVESHLALHIFNDEKSLEDQKTEDAWNSLKEIEAIQDARKTLDKFLMDGVQILFWSGVSLSIAGFSLWWWKVQRFHDKILLSEAQAKSEGVTVK